MAESEGFERPIRFPVCRFSSSTVGSEPLGQFPSLLYFSTGYQIRLLRLLRCHDPFCSVLNIELLQFYYSQKALPRFCRYKKRVP